MIGGWYKYLAIRQHPFLYMRANETWPPLYRIHQRISRKGGGGGLEWCHRYGITNKRWGRGWVGGGGGDQHCLYMRGLQLYIFLNFQRESDGEWYRWQKNKFLIFGNWLKTYSSLRIRIQNLQKVLLWPQKYLFAKESIWVSRNA
jgi:hypothetical protein